MTRTLALLLLLAGASAADPAVPWRTGLYEAYAAARDAKLPLVLYLYRANAPESAPFESELAAARVPEGAAIFCRQDAAQDDASGNVRKMLDSLGLKSTPVAVVLRCEAEKIQELGRIEGVPGAGAKLARLVAGARSETARMIAEAGYMPQRDETNPHEVYWIEFERDGWKFRFAVVPHPDGTLFWVVAPLATPEALASAPAGALLKLLAENDTLDRFQRFQVGAGTLYLCYTLPREGATAASLSTAIDALVQNVRRTEPLWNPAKWTHAS